MGFSFSSPGQKGRGSPGIRSLGMDARIIMGGAARCQPSKKRPAEGDGRPLGEWPR
jgi:hypothetical protein